QYALLMAMGTHQGLKAARPTERPFILTRAGFAGIQRYAAQWTGDNYSEWPHLAMSLPMSMAMGISGQAFVGSDVPGFMGRATAELATRWVQYGALTPFCRYHNGYGEPDQYPWSHGPGVEARTRQALELRYRLLPYIYTTFIQASQTGAPVQRPLVFHYQQDRHARETDDQYLLGDALLVAPILEAGRTSRHVYLPQGSWIDFHDGSVHSGSQFVTVEGSLDRAPLFGRGGSVVPAYTEAPRSTMNHRPKALELMLFVPSEDGEFLSQLREDDGETTAHESGAHFHTTFRVTRKGNRLALKAEVSGQGFPEFQRQSLRIRFRGAQPKSTQLNGAPRALEQDSLIFDNKGEAFELEAEL
ncbi:MAG TPA: TIM-barrel domain-containing protein, partial [Polyangiaceae bacterium]|nr:TIM-barrel domain-containing protein [Polyangiaceae bacterium]